MLAGADVVRYLLSSGGAVLVFFVAAIWASRTTTSRRARIFLLASAIFFTAVSIYALEFTVSRAIVGSLRPFQPADAVAGRRTALVVLGTGSASARDWDGRQFAVVDRTGASRVLEAARVFKMIDPAIVISSGGNPDHKSTKVPSGESMRDALVQLGIPRERILVETISRTTRDEALLVASILAEQRAEQVVIVTSETHMRRSLGAFRAAGVNAIPAIAHEMLSELEWWEWSLPSEYGMYFASLNAHELVGIGYYALRGWWK